MAPNRRKNDHHGGGGHGQFGQGHDHLGGLTSSPMKCCAPTECFQEGKLIYHEDIGTSDLEVVKIICNNDKCEQSGYMHKNCFEEWEKTILTFLKSCGRARSWSEKQRLQNLWTKKGYDLAFKACPCKCGKGHIRKDLDWIQPERSAPIAIPVPEAAAARPDEQNMDFVAGQMQGLNIQNGDIKKKKKVKTREARPTLSISAPVPHPNNNQARSNPPDSFNGSAGSVKTNGHGHLSSTVGSCSSSSGSTDLCCSPNGIAILSSRNRINSVSSNGSNSSSSSGGSGGSPPSPEAQFCSLPNSISAPMPNHHKFQRKNSKELLERTRRDSGGIFTRRMDFSSFNKLPRYKLNSYQIKMEEETHGNDDTRNLILATLLNSKAYRVGCILCNMSLAIFDRFPLIDGTFFLSPRQHSRSSLKVIQTPQNEGQTQYLSAVCMSCLEGWFTLLYCRFCGCRWDGSSLVIGSCYSYDIFAATPCCQERLTCCRCSAYVVNPERRPQYFSDYSRASCCQRCGLTDYHMAKLLPHTFNKTHSMNN